MRQLPPFDILGKGLEDSFVIVWKRGKQQLTRKRLEIGTEAASFTHTILLQMATGTIRKNR